MKKEREITIHDIAKSLNLSASTVSRALNNNPLINKKTRDRVHEFAQQNNYRRNTNASNLRTKATKTIGVIVPRIDRHYLSTLISGIENIAYKEGYTIVISQSFEDVEREKQIAQSMYQQRVDGLLVSISLNTQDVSHFDVFDQMQIPMIFMDRIPSKKSANCTVVDDQYGAYIATKHLIDQGCRSITFVNGPTTLELYQKREEGFRQAIKKMGLTQKAHYYECHLNRNEGTLLGKEILTKESHPEGLFCANDATALSMMLVAKDRNINIPKDMALIGFSNEPFSEVTSPSMSTIFQPGIELGEATAKLLIKKIQNYDLNIKNITFPTKLIVRESSLFGKDF